MIISESATSICSVPVCCAKTSLERKVEFGSKGNSITATIKSVQLKTGMNINLL
jgi:hypothetical protein